MWMLAHVKPVRRARGDGNQVIFFAQDCVKIIANMQGKQPTPGNEETHVIFAIAMLVKKPGSQLGFLRMVAVEADHIDSGIAALGHQLINLLAIGIDHFFVASTRPDRRGRLPAVKVNALLGQSRSNVFKVGQHLVRYFGA